jgi:ribosomal protein S18 acetylase RimI-like enzyme
MPIIEGPLLGQGRICEPILRALPQWFGIEESLVQYVRDIEALPTFIARIGDVAAGFISIRQHFSESAEMHVLGVRPEFHRRGIGRALVEHVERWLIEQNIEYLQVKTLGPSRPCIEYDLTRKFYQAMGFRPLEEFKTLWSERNPCLVMVKGL